MEGGFWWGPLLGPSTENDIALGDKLPLKEERRRQLGVSVSSLDKAARLKSKTITMLECVCSHQNRLHHVGTICKLTD